MPFERYGLFSSSAGYTRTDCMVIANVADNEGRIQALARCQFDTTFVHTSRAENTGGESSWIGLGRVSGTICCLKVIGILES